MFTLYFTFQKLAQVKRHVNFWRQVLTECRHAEGTSRSTRNLSNKFT